MNPAVPMDEEPLSAEALARLAGNASPEGVQLAGQLIDALTEVAPELLPARVGGPYAKEIARGADSIDDLLAEYARAGENEHRLGILQALYFIGRSGCGFTKVQIDQLRGILAAAPSPSHGTLAGTLLALAGDRDFLSSQLDALAQDDRAHQRAAAQFLGLGRFAVAVPRLLALLEPGNASVRTEVLWSLGELRSDEAVPALIRVLAFGASVPEVVDALGKIGDPSALPALLGVLVDGTAEQARAAARAVARITAAQGGALHHPQLEEDLRQALRMTFQRGDDPVASLYALAGYARLGGELTEAQVRDALGKGADHGRLADATGLFSPRK